MTIGIYCACATGSSAKNIIQMTHCVSAQRLVGCVICPFYFFLSRPPFIGQHCYTTHNTHKFDFFKSLSLPVQDTSPSIIQAFIPPYSSTKPDAHITAWWFSVCLTVLVEMLIVRRLMSGVNACRDQCAGGCSSPSVRCHFQRRQRIPVIWLQRSRNPACSLHLPSICMQMRASELFEDLKNTGRIADF